MTEWQETNLQYLQENSLEREGKKKSSQMQFLSTTGTQRGKNYISKLKKIISLESEKSLGHYLYQAWITSNCFTKCNQKYNKTGRQLAQ